MPGYTISSSINLWLKWVNIQPKPGTNTKWAASWQNQQNVHPAKSQISLGICPVWSESSLFAGRKLGSLATHWAQSEDSDLTGWMPRLIWVFAGRTSTLLVLSWGGSNMDIFGNQGWVIAILMAIPWRLLASNNQFNQTTIHLHF